MKAGIAAVGIHQLLGAAIFDDAPFLEHDDAVSDLNCRQPVGNDYCCPFGEDRSERSLHEAFARNV